MLLLVLGNLMIWGYVGWFILARKSGFLDDAYIYLQMASNILERGTARFFPLNESWALLASSPLRLLTMLPGAFLARLMAEPRSVEAARLTFLLSGPVTGLVFLPFFRRKTAYWGVGMLAAGALAVCTESALQMEGLLVFWILLVLGGLPEERLSGSPRLVGVLAGLLLLARPEFGLPALAGGFGWAVMKARGRERAWFAGAAWVGLGWIIIAVALRVYPVPTTYLAKVVTGRTEMFGPTFGAMFIPRLGTYFLGREDWPGYVAWIIPLAMMGAIATGSTRLRLLCLLPVAAAVLDRNAGGNYPWYFENLMAGTGALAICRLAEGGTAPGRKFLEGGARVVLVGIIGLMVAVNWGEPDRASGWSLRGAPSTGYGYRNIGQAYGRAALFALPRTPPSYLVMVEIGMVSYFAGPDVWLCDRGGLAQPGTLAGVKEHPLARLYPQGLLVSAGEELARINTRFGREGDWPPIWKAWAWNDDATGPGHCDIYLPELEVCLQRAGRPGP